MTRPHFSRKERERHFGRRMGICYLCGGCIDPVREAFEIEHRNSWEISRDNSDENLYLAHVKCHKVKSAADAGILAKVKRIEAKHLGLAPPSRAKIKSRGFAKSRVWPASGNGEAYENSD